MWSLFKPNNQTKQQTNQQSQFKMCARYKGGGGVDDNDDGDGAVAGSGGA